MMFADILRIALAVILGGAGVYLALSAALQSIRCRPVRYPLCAAVVLLAILL